MKSAYIYKILYTDELRSRGSGSWSFEWIFNWSPLILTQNAWSLGRTKILGVATAGSLSSLPVEADMFDRQPKI